MVFECAPPKMVRVSGPFRVVGVGLALALISVAAFTSFGPSVAIGQENTGPSFAPQVSTAAPSATPIQTALPNPISRPEDARGINQTTAPFVPPSGFSPPPVPPSSWIANVPSFSVPCQLHGNRIYLGVVVDGRPQTFLLDSAAPFSIVDPGSAPSHDAPVKLHTLQFGDVLFNSLTAGVAKVASAAEAFLGKPVDGILGQELFLNYPVRIDYQPCAVTVYRDVKAQLDASPSPDARPLPLRIINGQPQIETTFDGGRNAQLVIDTASDADADVSQEFWTQNNLAALSAIPELRRWLPSGMLSGATARVSAFDVGPFPFDRALVGVIYTSGRTTGYLGNGFLQNFSVLFNEPAMQLTLTPISNSRRFTTYDRSGAWLVIRQNGIMVKSILPNSPAAKVLSPGDRIVAVNGQPAGELDAVRALLAAAPGSTVTVTYQRNGRQHSGSMVLKTLL
ncbi:MAG TPA: PDZ domain-containing protein [Candidatus Binatus sp.]|nr:PDZ domain-containing protein [Candidatus Binatus sp.]